MPLTRDQFEVAYGCPLWVRGKFLEDVDCIRNYYRDLMIECNTIPEMMRTAREFGFLSWGVVPELNRLSNFWVDPIKEYFTTTKDPADYEISFIAPITVPKVMLHATVIAKKFHIPEYYAALQYVRATLFYNPQTDGE